jgi:hypothetical protein
MKNRQIKYAAEIHNVKEMTLVCTADKNVWSSYLKRFGLIPLGYNGSAKILLIASEMKYMKVQFREVAISIFARKIDDESGAESTFLLHAYNSNKFFAWSERKFFSTPYYHADISFDSREYSGTEVMQDNTPLISVKNTINSRVPKFEGNEQWDGMVYLPFNYNKRKQKYKWFYATLLGDTVKYDYSNEEDLLIVNSSGSNEILKLLNKSDCTGYEWVIRKSAFHAKSKTYSSTLPKLTNA